ncbi:hypothetical protein HDV05_001260 [Chytridiales sp. JEL 0842]|nr:hypothetical protein HDV05_001260 [Chytridiales sp. JEL 0842]
MDKKPEGLSYAARAAAAAAASAGKEATSPSSTAGGDRKKSSPDAALKVPVIKEADLDEPQTVVAGKPPSRSPSPNPDGKSTWANSRLHKKSGEALASDDSWKAVGSPPRRMSASVPQTPAVRNTSDSSSTPSHSKVPASSNSDHHDSQDDEESDDLVLSRKRNFRTRAASTPNPLVSMHGQHHGGHTEGGYALLEEEEAHINGHGADPFGAPGGAATKWGGLGGLQGWGAGGPPQQPPGIWAKDDGSEKGPSRMGVGMGGRTTPTFLGPEGPSSKDGRPYRSFSFSIDEEEDPHNPHLHHHSHHTGPSGAQSATTGKPRYALRHPQGPPTDDDDYAEYSAPSKARTRSKSSSAIYGFQDAYGPGGNGSGSMDAPPGIPAGGMGVRGVWRKESGNSSVADDSGLHHHHHHGHGHGHGGYAEGGPSIWGPGGGSGGGGGGLLHRRASTQPSGSFGGSAGGGQGVGAGWGGSASGPASGAGSETGSDGVGPAGGLSPERMDRYRTQRRFSHAPNLYSELAGHGQGGAMSSRVHQESDFQYEARRRHSLAGPPLFNSRFLGEQFENMYIGDGPDGPFYDEINDYFENTEHRAKAWAEAGKNLGSATSGNGASSGGSFSHPWPLFVVEFKAGRTDFFYASDANAQQAKVGDLVIVEADRGKDLGKVIVDNIANAAQLQVFQANHVDIMVDSHLTGKEVHPKRIHRLALPGEIAMLVPKSQDEAKAMGVCQTKIRQRKLPMEVVDAEFQWDRRKLTFYFVADHRIDFRELVRDLFKLYKTRIWMCAVDPAKLVR